MPLYRKIRFNLKERPVGWILVVNHVCSICSPPHAFYIGNIGLCPVNRRILGYSSHLAQYGNSCYEWFTDDVSWEHAETNCKSHGGHLVQIKDVSEESFIQWFLNTHDPRHAIWIGLHDNWHEETFTWTSGIFHMK